MKVAMAVELDSEKVKEVGLDGWIWKFDHAIEDWTDVFVAIAAAHMLDGSYEQFVKTSEFQLGYRVKGRFDR